MTQSPPLTSDTALPDFLHAGDVLMHAPFGIFMYGPDGRLLFTNHAFALMHDQESPEAMLRSTTDVTARICADPEDRKAFLELLERHGQVVNYECCFENTDKGPFWASLNVQAMRDRNGRISHYQGFCSDITDRKLAGQSMSVANARLEALWSISALATADLKKIADHTLASLTRMTGSRYGFFGFLDETESTMIIHSWSGEAMRNCALVDKPVHFSIDQAGVWAEAVRRRAPLILNDYSVDHPAKKGFPHGHVPLVNILVVPCIVHGRITSVAAVANHVAGYDQDDVEQVRAFLSSIQAIVDGKRAEAELADQKARYQAIWDGAPVSIWEEDWSGVTAMLDRLQEQGVDEYGTYFEEHPEFVAEALRTVKILDVNEETVWMFHGRDRTDMLASLETVFSSPDTLPGFIGELNALAQGKHSYTTEMRLRRLDKELIHVLLNMSFFPNNTPPGTVLVSLIDITERKRMEQALHKSDEKFQTIANFTSDWEYWLAPDGALVYVSPSCEQITGYPARAFMDDPGLMLRIIHSEDKDSLDCYETVRATALDEVHIGQDFRIITHTGEIRWIAHRCQAVYSRDGQFLGRRGSNRDITDRKLAEQEVHFKNDQLQKALTEKDAFFSIIAHDLKSPLSGLLGITNLLVEDVEGLTIYELRRLAKEMGLSVQNLFNLLENLLEWSQMERGMTSFEPSPCSLVELVNSNLELLQTVAEQKKITLQNAVAADTLILADQPMLNTVLRNLISNAVKFVESGGRVDVSARKDGAMVAVAVRDNGIGMDRKTLTGLFALNKNKSRRGTAGEKGTGLGLMLCKQFIEQHGGQVWAESEPGKGTTVFFTLPVND
jgi:PAS domain S-box-containing protein